MSSTKFTLICLAIAAVFIGLSFPLSTKMGWDLTALIAAVVISAASTIMAFVLANAGIDKSGAQFFQLALGGMGLKFFVGLLSAVVVIFVFKSVAKEYVYMYFFSYFVFMGLDVFVLMRNLRPFSKSNENTESK